MEITLYRYVTKGARWTADSLSGEDYDVASESMISLPFQGDEDDKKYGIVKGGHQDDVIFGLFVQKHPIRLIDYDLDTKEEVVQSALDSGEYLFLFFPKQYELFLQAKRSADLPSQEEIAKRFTGMMKLANNNNKLFFNELKMSEDYVNRDKIVRIFYEDADEVIGLELEDFDPLIITEQKNQRGRRQTYFNPREEYQEAMEEAGLKFATHAKKIDVKAKEGESLKKDPIARAMLEGSNKPAKIIYRKNSETIIASGVQKRKEVISIEGDYFDLEEQIESIIQRLRGLSTYEEERNITEDQERLL